MHAWDFPGSLVVKAPCFHCRAHRFDPWSGKFRVMRPKKKCTVLIKIKMNTSSIVFHLFENLSSQNGGTVSLRYCKI